MASSFLPTICIVSPNAYGVMSGVDTGHIGGIEVQTPLMAKWLVKNGFKVSMITWDHGQEDGKNQGGVALYKTCRESDGIPLLRFVWPRWTSLYSAMKRADADIYYYNCGDMLLGQMAFWCKSHKRKLVYSVACDQDCIASFPILKPLRERVLYRYGLFNCNKIAVQTEKQKNLLLSELGLPSVQVHMPCAGFASNHNPHDKVKLNARKRVMWAGRFSHEKRFEWLIEIAKRLPEIDFDVLGSKNKLGAYDTNLIEQAEGIDNIFLRGRIPHEQMGSFYDNSDLLLCTSIYEGFPNTFLEAWSVATPVVTTVDPDNVVERHQLGAKAETVDGLVQAINNSLKAENWLRLSTNAKTYFGQHHAIEQAMSGFSTLFKGV